MTEYIIDAYAWMEYLNGSKSGEIVKGILEKENCFTSAVTLAEVISKIKRSGLDAKVAFEAVTLSSKVLQVDENTANAAGLIHAEKRKTMKNFGLADAFILAQREPNKIIVTGDPHFFPTKNIKMI